MEGVKEEGQESNESESSGEEEEDRGAIIGSYNSSEVSEIPSLEVDGLDIYLLLVVLRVAA